MPRKTITPFMRTKISKLRDAHDALILASRNVRRDVEDEIERRLDSYRRDESRLMNECLNLGIPKTVIAAQVGTSNWTSLAAKYELTAHEFTAEKVAERQEHARGPQFEHDAWEGRLKVKWWEDRDGVIHEEGATLTQTPVEGGWFDLPFVVITPGALNAFEQYLRDDFERVTGEDWADDRARANPDNASEVARLHLAVSDWWKEQGK